MFSNPQGKRTAPPHRTSHLPGGGGEGKKARNAMPRMSTARMGPTEHSATRPKLSSAAWRSPRIADTPTPSAMMKGTVMGPVVTAGVKGHGQKLLGHKGSQHKNDAVERHQQQRRQRHAQQHAQERDGEEQAHACRHRENQGLVRDGGHLIGQHLQVRLEMVMRNPSRKPMPKITGSLRLWVITAPTRSPMGVMLISAPSVKNMMPTTIMARTPAKSTAGCWVTPAQW